MPDIDDPRYQRLFSALFTGEFPEWLSNNSTRLRLASDDYRLGLSEVLGGSLPRASFYAVACFGIDFIDGVAKQFLRAPASEPNQTTFRSSVVSAALEWSSQIERPDVAALFDYDHWRATRPANDDFDNPVLVDNNFSGEISMRAFTYDVLSFGQLLDGFRRKHAPREITSRYQPKKREQLLACNLEEPIFVREISL